MLEPSAAITVAAIGPLIEAGLIDPGARVLAVATGHGLKDLSHVEIDVDAAIPPDIHRLLERLDA